VDVFASADQDPMDAVGRAGALAGAQHVFARNRLTLIAPRDNPARVTSLLDLARPGVRVIGASASQDTVCQMVARIQLGGADAAIVYTTDITSRIADQFVSIDLPEELQVIATYPIAVADGRNRAGGDAFAAYVLSPPAQDSLVKWRFPRPAV
jgi:molybdate transport system substrate-binding protein